MFYSAEFLTRRGVYALAWLAGTTENITVLRGYLDRMIRHNGRANILNICASILQPIIPLSLRLRAILMLGIVRLFSEQVKETEKDAQMCMRRIRHRTAQAKPAGTSLIDTLVEPGIESQDMLDLWKKNRRLLHMIDCAAGTAPTINLSVTNTSTTQTSADLHSTIWRDNLGLGEMIPEPDLLRGGGLDVDSSFISIPHLGAPLSWPSDRSVWQNHSDSASETGLDPMRGDLAIAEPILPMPHFDMPLDDTKGDSMHFLDRLIEDHDGFPMDQDELMRSTLNESVAENIHQKLDDLLAPTLLGADMVDEPLLQSLYCDNYIDRDEQTYHYGNEGVQDAGEFGIEKSVVDDLSGDLSRVSGPKSTKSRHRTYILDDEPRISHKTSKATIEKFFRLPPRADRDVLKDPILLEARVQEARLASKNFLEVETIMGLPRGKSFQMSGALAYARLVCLTHLANGAPTASHMSSMNEMSFVNPNDVTLDVMTGLPLFPPPNGSMMDMIQDPGERYFNASMNDGSMMLPGAEYTDYDQNDDRGLWEGVASSAAIGGIVSGGGDEDLVLRFGDDVRPNFGFPQADTGNLIAIPAVSASQLLVSSQMSAEARRSHDSEHSAFLSEGGGHGRATQGTTAQQPLEGLSRALLSYLAVKAAPPADSNHSHSSDRTHASSSQASTSTSADARKLSFSLINGSQSQGGAPFSVSSLLQGSKRRTAAKTFLHLLELAHSNHIMLIQENPFDDIAIAVIQ